MREYLAALRAIWDTWQNGTPLRFKGDHYSFTLMTPFFNPGPIDHPEVPIFISAVNPLMARLAGETCAGIHIHPFHTTEYLKQVVVPEVKKGADIGGRSPDEVALAAVVFVVSGKTEADREASQFYVRQQIAFYASTPAYRLVLETHGWDFGEKLTAMSKRGEWMEMASLISDEVLEQVAVIAPLEEVGDAIRSRYEGLLSRVAIYDNPGLASLDDDDWSALATAVKA